MNFPDDLRYSPDHLWVRLEGDIAFVGISDFAQDQLGKVIYVDLPAVGQELSAGAEMGAVESAKSVSDLIAPIDGEVVEVNPDLAIHPASLNEDPYGLGWVAKVRVNGPLPAELMDAATYQARLA
ncbi:MAG: glycine cleavage system protein GcvH [Pseudomonadota bacterium]